MKTIQTSADLQKIVDACKDSVEGYKMAAEKATNSTLKTLFLRLTQQRRRFIEEIKSEARRLGVKIDADGTVKGYFHRHWLATKATFGSDTNQQVIDESIRGEKEAVEIYSKVFINRNLPEYLYLRLKEQQSQIQVAITQLRNIVVDY